MHQAEEEGHYQVEEVEQCIILKAMIFGFSSGRGGVVYQAEEEGQCIKRKRRSNVSSETGGAVHQVEVEMQCFKQKKRIIKRKRGSSASSGRGAAVH